MNEYVIEDPTPDSPHGNYKYKLIRNGEVVLTDFWGNCLDEMLRLAQDGDLVTPGRMIVDRPAGEYRRAWEETTRKCQEIYDSARAKPAGVQTARSPKR